MAGKLFNAHAISTPVISYHQHNASQRDRQILTALNKGQQVALISDAGTPLISDPGHSIVALCFQHHFRVVPVPGACALVAALSVNGFNVNRFCFEGFLPPRPAARLARLHELASRPCASAVYEAKHRMEALLADVLATFGADRKIIIARELTKRHEQIVCGDVQTLIAQWQAGTIPRQGEFVVILQGDDGSIKKQQEIADMRLLFKKVAGCLTHRDALELALKLSSLPKNILYDLAGEYYRGDK